VTFVMMQTVSQTGTNLSVTSQVFVLVHGAWHGGWCWRRVAEALRSAGHMVFTPTLTGLGERAHLLHPGLTVEDFATDVAKVIEAEELERVILVGHSFAGGPITVVADRMPEALKWLVYVDAVLPKDGESAFDSLDSTTVAHRIKLARESSGGLTIPAPSPAAFGVIDAQDAAWLERRLTPHPLNSYQTPIRLTHPLGNGIPKTYLACSDPVYEPLVPTHEWVKRQDGWRYLEFASGHDAMIIRPKALAEVLARCA
jgi:pimeloyl-ACP methyl ester carboxylesterase